MLKVIRRMLAALLIVAAATAGSVSLAGPTAHSAAVRGHVLADMGWPFCCHGGG